MMGWIGLVLAAGGGWGAWWAFEKAAAEGAFNWGQPLFILAGLIGLVMCFIVVRQWWIAD